MACSTVVSTPPPVVATSLTTRMTTLLTVVMLETPTQPETATAFVIETYTGPVSTITPDVRLTARYWRKWPVVPELSINARTILMKAAQSASSLKLDRFSKVGDCQFTAGTFLAGYVNGVYPIPDGLEATVSFYRESMIRDSITSKGGFGINSVLNPLFGLAAGNVECASNETPLDCELRVNKPTFVLVAMGTNWSPHAEISYEKYLRRVVDTILAAGALPILSTKADNVEQDWKLNEVTAQVAYEYDLPLVNIWRAVQFLPNQGLDPASPKGVYLSPEAWGVRNDVWLRVLQLVRVSVGVE